MSRLSGFTAETTWNPASIADGDEAALDVTVPGAKLGDFAFATLGVDIADGQLSATVTAADTVTVVLSNSIGGALDLASSTLRVKVVPYDVI